MPPLNTTDPSKTLENRVAVLEKAIQVTSGQIVLQMGRSTVTITDSGITLECAGTVEIDAKNIVLTGLSNIQMTSGMNTVVSAGSNVQMTCGASALITTGADVQTKATRNLTLSGNSATISAGVDAVITAGHDITMTAAGNATVNSGANTQIKAAGNLAMKGAKIVQN